MKVLLLQIGDIHISEKSVVKEEQIKVIYKALNQLPAFEKCILIMCGDIAFGGKKEEYRKAKIFIEEMSSGIKSIINMKTNSYKDDSIEVVIIPGNHDVDFDKLDKQRKCEDILNMYKQPGGIVTSLFYENIAMENYFDFSGKFNCFEDNRICSIKYIQCGEINIKFNLINSAYFSTLYPDDKQIHFYPNDQASFDKLYCDEQSDVVVTVIHHSTEWFNCEVNKKFENAIYKNTSFLFFAHDHYSQSKSLSVDNAPNIEILCGGKLNLDGYLPDDEFNTVCLDTESLEYQIHRFSMLLTNRKNLFEQNLLKTDVINLTRENKYICKTGWIENFYQDDSEISDSIWDYFSYPTMSIIDKLNQDDDGAKKRKPKKTSEQVKNKADFDKVINNQKYILIKGKKHFGKTTVLKKMHYDLSVNKIPLFLSVREVVNFKPQNLIRVLFEEQYSSVHSDYVNYQTMDKASKIILVDDFDYIDKRRRDDLLKFLVDQFSTVILSCKDDVDFDIIDHIKQDIYFEKFKTYIIEPFYKIKRQELVQNISKLLGVTSKNQLSGVFQSVNGHFTNPSLLIQSTPKYIIQLTAYYIRNYNEINIKVIDNQSIFNLLYETNINCEILKHSKEEAASMKMAMQEVAFFMHYNKVSVVSLAQICNVIESYNKEYYKDIDPENFIDVFTNARIIKKVDGGYKFIDYGHLAYFVAKSIIQNWDDGNDLKYFDYYLKNICYEINDTIILFIAYITNNKKIILKILEEVQVQFQDAIELDLGENNIAFLNANFAINHKIYKEPDEEECQNYEKESENIEKALCEVEVKDLYSDYDDESVDDDLHKAIKAIKCMQIIAKALPDFSDFMKKDIQLQLVEAIYKLPNYFLYNLLKPLDESYDRTISELMENYPDLNESHIKNLVFQSSIILIICIYEIVAQLATDQRSINILDSYEIDQSLNYRILNLFCLAYAKRTEDMIQRGKRIYNKSKTTTIAMIRHIMRKYIFDNPQLKHNYRDEITSSFFGKDDEAILKKELLKLKMED